MIKKTLIDIIKERKNLESKGVRFITGDSEEDFVSYNDLYKFSLKALLSLQKRGVKPKNELVFQIDDNKTFIILFWACIIGGIVPVPVSIGRNDEHKRKLFLILKILNNPYVVCSSQLLTDIKKFSTQENLNEETRHFLSNYIDVSSVFKENEYGVEYPSKANDIAFIQFSSGSTTTPKGVVLTHENLITNINAISAAAEYSGKDSLLSWMPLTHDMGMIGFHINPLFCGINHYIIPTSLFVRKPALWFKKVSEHRVTVIGSPNFGYSYVLKYCTGKKQDWDLRSVRIFYNGAEPISRSLCDEFLDKMSIYGLKQNAICPVYGLAEASLAVSISNLEDKVISHKFLRNRLNIGDEVSITNRKDSSLDIVNVGKSIDDCEIQIVDNRNRPLREKIIGNIMIRGKNVTKGYYNNPIATKNAINRNGWLKTGDIGFIVKKSLYITGREKDIIFLNGQNYYPHDIEKIAEGIAEVELNKIVAVGYYDKELEEEKIVSFVFYRGKIEKFLSLAVSIKELVNRKMGIEINKILPVKDIPRTTSGKLQRYKLLQEFLDGRYSEIEKELEKLSHRIMPGSLILPTNEKEKRIARIWERILKMENVGINQEFFSIGGNSLKLSEMIMEIHKEFGVEISYETFYEMQTIRGISERLIDLNKKEFDDIIRVGKAKDYPVSYSQKRIYYAWAMDKTSTAYNVPVAFKVKGFFDFHRVETAIHKLISRHSMLRASFIESEDPRFTIAERITFKLRRIKCKPENINVTLNKLVEPFDLLSGDLFKVILLNINEKLNILFLDFHHIIADGLSVYQFMEELIALYYERSLPKIHVDFTDYVFWQQKKLLSKYSKQQEKFWLSAFEKEIPFLELPLDNPRETILNTKGRRIPFQVGKENSDSLRNLAKQNHTTLHGLLFSIYKWFLAKLTGQYDIVIGIPASGRIHSELQNLFGMFVNNLPVKVSIRQNESFQNSLMRDIKAVNLALQNQEYPYSKLLDTLGKNRDVSRNPLFDTMFLYLHTDLIDETNDFQIERHFFDPGYSKFDLSMEIIEEDNITYIMEFSTTLFKETTIARFSGYFASLMKQVVSDPEVIFSKTSILSQDEYVEHVQMFNATKVAYNETKNESVISLFEERVHFEPNKIAIEFKNKNIDFRKLNDLAGEFKSNLEKEGVSKGDVVSVCLKRSPDVVVVLLGILKLGAVYLPIEFTTPNERIYYIINDSGSKVLVCSSAKDQFKNLKVKKMYIEDGTSAIANEARTYSEIIEPSDLTYIIYTSGTTGVPKGVAISSEAIMNYINWASKEYIGTTPAAFALFTSLGFDLTLTSIFLPLVSGNKIVIYENENEQELTAIFTENKVTHLKLTPSHLKMVINNKLLAPSNKLEKVIVGGEKLMFDVASRFINLSEQDIVMYNEYGPTEATIGCMFHKFDPSDRGTSVPIGIPISNSIIYLLDEFLEPVPIGVIGELYISGRCLAKDYLNNTALTTQKFISNPFMRGELMYKSGDLARRLPSGIVEYIGRRDTQIKIKGHRIEKEEVRKSLLEYAGINEVIIDSNENNNGELELYAFYITDSNLNNNNNKGQVDLKSFLLKKLPYFMVPLYFFEIDKIPLNKNGKVDYKSLLGLKQEGRVIGPPQNSMSHELIIETYKEVFDEAEITLQTNFYELGGDSIKATQIASKLYQKGIKITPREVLIYNTIEQIGHFIETKQKPLLYNIELFQGVIEGDKKLSPIESWFVNKNFHNPNFYNQSVLLELKKNVQKEVLQETFKKLIHHHDGLRLNFDEKKRVLFFNKNHFTQDFKIDVYCVKSAVELTVVLEHIKGSFDLEHSLLFKVALIIDESKSQKTEMLFVTAHHLVIDGLSWRILMEDMYNMYHSLIEKKEAHLPKKTASLIIFKEKLDSFASENKIEEEIAYWESLNEIMFKIPLDFQTDEWIVENSSIVFGELDKKNTCWLLSESHRFNVDIHTLLNVALAGTLSRWVGVETVKFEIENHGRYIEDLDVSRTVGWFTVIHPVVFNLVNDIRQDIKEVKETIKNIPNHGIAYGLLNDEETLSVEGADIAEVRFNYLGQFGTELSNDLFNIRNFSTGKESAKENQLTAKFEINSMVVNNKLHLEFLYNSKAHKKDTIENISKSFFKNLVDLIDFFKNEKEYLLTPSDFQAAKITQHELDSLFD